MFAHIHPHAPRFHPARSIDLRDHVATTTVFVVLVAAVLLLADFGSTTAQQSPSTSASVRLSPKQIGERGLAAERLLATRVVDSTPAVNALPQRTTGSTSVRLSPKQIGERGLAAERHLRAKR